VLQDKIEKLLAGLEDIEHTLGNSELDFDTSKYKKLSQKHAYLCELKDIYQEFQLASKTLAENKILVKQESDPEFISFVKEEIENLESKVEILNTKLKTLLVPPDPRDHANVIMEIRAGTGGDEAAIFVGDCARMYRLYADQMKWKMEILTLTDSEAGGHKEIIVSISGKNVHRYLQYEAGTHRVQRVPITEGQGRVHTSAITIAILIEPGEEEKIDVDEKDLKIDTYRASGAGGQHVNTTDSAVRITHTPTGVVVYCQEERSQHKNKEKALRILVAKLAEEKRRKQAEERASLRSSQVGSGDRSERIRTYNFPQNRVTDHRIKLTLYKLDQIMEGNLREVSEALISHFHDEKLKNED